MTKRIFRIFLATLLVAALSLSMLAGCGASKDNTSNGTPADSSNSNADQNKKDEKITLRVAWWGNQVRNDGTVKALELYSQQNPNILVGLKQIPDSLYEAATVDGCSKIKKFFTITLPMLTPVIFFNLVQQTINAFMAFTQSYVITGGGPLDSTLFYSVYMYRQSFEFYKMGYGSALAWFMLFVVATLTALIFKSSTMWVYRESKGE